MYPIVSSKYIHKQNDIQMYLDIAKCIRMYSSAFGSVFILFCRENSNDTFYARTTYSSLNKWNQHLDFVPEWSQSSVFQNHCLACKLSIGLTWIHFFSKQIITLRKNNFSPQTQIDHRRASFVKSSQNASNR